MFHHSKAAMTIESPTRKKAVPSLFVGDCSSGSSLRIFRARFPAMWATPLHAPVTTFVPGSSVPACPEPPFALEAALEAERFPLPITA
ncbi:hypothetical protein DN508_34395 [Burkholderia multivorans]|nr:hypothetical protein DN508_34395 [Burkholderia multivorans]